MLLKYTHLSAKNKQPNSAPFAYQHVKTKHFESYLWSELHLNRIHCPKYYDLQSTVEPYIGEDMMLSQTQLLHKDKDSLQHNHYKHKTFN